MAEYDITALYHEATERHSFYTDAATYADHGGTLAQSDPLLKKVMNERGGNTRFNFCGRIIKAYLSRLRLGGVTVRGEAPTGQTQLLSQLGRHVNDLCRYGDAYLLVWPFADDNGDEGVEVRAVDPLSTRVLYEDGLPVIGLRHWNEGHGTKALRRLDVYDTEELQRWVSKDGKDWKPYTADGIEGTVPHQLGVVPLFHTRNGDPCGAPVHFEGYGAQDMIMRLVIAHGASIDFLGWPQIYALYEMNTSAGTAELGDTEAADSGAAAITDDVSTLKRDPGSIWALRAKSIGQIQPASSSDFISSLNSYLDFMASLTGVPARYFLAPGGQHPSGDSLTTADSDFRQSVGDIADNLDATFKNVVAMAMTLSGMGETTPEDVEVMWKPQEIQQGREFWEMTRIKQDAGVPLSATLEEAGYPPERVKEFETVEAGDLTMIRRVEILDKLGDALGKLSALTGTGMIDQAKVDTMIEALFHAE